MQSVSGKPHIIFKGRPITVDRVLKGMDGLSSERNSRILSSIFNNLLCFVDVEEENRLCGYMESGNLHARTAAVMMCGSLLRHRIGERTGLATSCAYSGVVRGALLSRYINLLNALLPWSGDVEVSRSVALASQRLREGNPVEPVMLLERLVKRLGLKAESPADVLELAGRAVSQYEEQVGKVGEDELTIALIKSLAINEGPLKLLAAEELKKSLGPAGDRIFNMLFMGNYLEFGKLYDESRRHAELVFRAAIEAAFMYNHFISKHLLGYILSRRDWQYLRQFEEAVSSYLHENSSDYDLVRCASSIRIDIYGISKGF